MASVMYSLRKIGSFTPLVNRGKKPEECIVNIYHQAFL